MKNRALLNQGKNLVPATTEVCYRDRQTGQIISEINFSTSTLRWFYEDSFGFKVFNYLLNNQFFCWFYGRFQDLPTSRSKISKFIVQHHLDLEEIELPLESYRSFNAFFSRRLKPDARPFNTDPDVFCAPADGKVLAYPQLQAETQIPIKGDSISIESLLASVADVQRFRRGAALIVRLAPYDYHRFHFPDRGKANAARYMKGRYHSVNPIALAKVPNLYCYNKRSVTEFSSEHFGRIAYVEVGAITIGSIVQTYNPGTVARGQEKGYFQYGGSTLVLLFEPGAIAFDRDLVQDSAHGLENHVLAGSKLGKKQS